MNEFNVNISELIELADDLDKAATELPKYLRKAIEVTARHVKDDAQKTVRRRKGLGHAAYAIDYELEGFQGPMSGMNAEIGYNKGHAAGNLGNLIEFGAPNAKAHMLVVRGGRLVNVPVPGSPSRPLAPSADLQNALAKNRDDFQRGVAAAVDDAMREVGL